MTTPDDTFRSNPRAGLEGREYESTPGDATRARWLSALVGIACMGAVSLVEGMVAFPFLFVSALGACLVTGALRVRDPRAFLVNAAIAVALALASGICITALDALL